MPVKINPIKWSSLMSEKGEALHEMEVYPPTGGILP